MGASWVRLSRPRHQSRGAVRLNIAQAHADEGGRLVDLQLQLHPRLAEDLQVLPQDGTSEGQAKASSLRWSRGDSGSTPPMFDQNGVLLP